MYQPTNEQAKWLRKWKATGRPLRGEHSIRNNWDFEKVKENNIIEFKNWFDSVFTELCGATGVIQKKEKPAKRKKQVGDPEQVTHDDDVDLFMPENQKDEEG